MVNLGLGYKFQNVGVGKNLSIQLNINNVADKKYVSTIGSNGFGNAGDNQTFLAGSPIQYFLSVGGQF